MVTSLEAINDDDAKSGGWRAKRDHIMANRALSVPVLTIRRFFSISGTRKASQIAFNLFIGVIPVAIMGFALFSIGKKNISLSQVMIEQFRLKGRTADIIRSTFSSNRSIIKVASFITIASFAITGFDVAAATQNTFSEAWETPPIKGWRGALRGAIWFVLVFGQFGLTQLLQYRVGHSGTRLLVGAIPLCFFSSYALWLVTPRLMLGREFESSALRPGAVLGAIVSTFIWLTGRTMLPGWFDWYGRGFGPIGIGLALLSWTYVTAISWVVIIVGTWAYWTKSTKIEDLTA